ncbi:MAG: beta-lactamase family protein [Anaerolineae bacterium]|nr:beta-lactamase family protein [Anaerolineae bacterium]
MKHEQTWENLCAFVTELLDKTHIPGVAVGILHKGEITAGGFGVTNVDHPLPVTADTLFQVGSITKTFVGTAIMRLVEMGKLDLDEPVRTYVPEFRVADENASARVTLRHLLTHMGGWDGDFFDDTGPGDDALPLYVAKMAELAQLAPVNTHLSYNNAGFSLAGYIIEVVTGQRFHEVMYELVIDPLGLDYTFLDPYDVMTHRFVVGHNVSGVEAEVEQPWALPRANWPAGAIVCHVKDLLRYAQFHLGDGSTTSVTGEKIWLLSPESMAEMQQQHVQVWGTRGWGLSWATGTVDGVYQVSHSGGTNGQTALLILVPDHEFAVAILTNANQGRKITRKVSQWALREYLDINDPDPTPIESTIDDLAQYVGFYSRPFVDIELGMLNGKLVGQMVVKLGFPIKDVPPTTQPPPFTLGRCEEDRLLVLDGPLQGNTFDMIRRADGTIGWLREASRICPRVD